MLGMGFEERGEALDFSIALQEVRKVLGMEVAVPAGKTAVGLAPMMGTTPRSAGMGVRGGRAGFGVERGRAESATGAGAGAGFSGREEGKYIKRDLSLKEGEMLHIGLPGRSGIEPPSGGGLVSPAGMSGFALLPPPPSAREVREDHSQQNRVGSAGGSGDAAQDEKKMLEEMGFDDGEFGEFQ